MYFTTIKKERGWVQWLMPIALASWEAETRGSLESSQAFKTSLYNIARPRLLNNNNDNNDKQLARHGGTSL